MTGQPPTSSRTITRRRFLKGVGILAGARLALGSLREVKALGRAEAEPRDLVFVINNGDGSVSVIDAATDELVKTYEVGTSASFPSNKRFKRGPIIATGLHVNQAKTVHIVDLEQGRVVREIETGSTQNYSELTPDGAYIIVAARFVDRFLKIGADPQSPDFGEVVAAFKHIQGSRPCDITLTPDGSLAFAPDRGTDSLSVLDVESFEVIATVPVPPLVAEPPIEPFMATASRDGALVFVENIEGEGTVGVFDVRDPTQPKEIQRFSQEDGLGLRPLTDEFTLDNAFNFIINRNSNDITVVDFGKLEITNTIPLVPGGNPVAGDFSISGERFYVPIQNQNAVAVVDVENQEMIKTIQVGPQPVGAVALHIPVPPVEGVALGSLPKRESHGCTLPCCGAA